MAVPEHPRPTPAFPFWTCVCGTMNIDRRAVCLWCNRDRDDAPTERPNGGA